MAKAKRKAAKRTKPIARVTGRATKAKAKARRTSSKAATAAVKRPADPVCQHCGRPKSEHATRFLRCPATSLQEPGKLTMFLEAAIQPGPGQNPPVPVQEASGSVEASDVGQSAGNASRADEDAPASDAEECSVCGGVGYVCQTCGNASGQCTCPEGIDEVPCPECGGASPGSAFPE